MPNWKSYESSVRLLSAIIAAHPELKLKYDEVGRYYADGVTYKAVWGRMTQINKNAVLIRAAVDAGQNPFEVELPSEGKEIARRFGGDCTISAVENRFRRIKTDAKLINDAIARSIDPMTLAIGNDEGKKEVVRFYGSDLTKSALLNHCTRNLNPNVKALKQAVESGADPKTVVLVEGVRGGSSMGKEVVKFYGKSATREGVLHRFRRDIIPNVNLLKEAVARGEDPDNIVLVEGVYAGRPVKEIQKHFGNETTKAGIGKYFARNILPNAKSLKEAVANDGDPTSVVMFSNVRDGKPGTEIARCYGESVTPKSISNIFQRNIKPDVKLIRETLSAGGDPEKVLLSMLAKTSGGNEIARCYGTSLKGHALSMHFTRNIKPAANLILEALARGEDPAETVPVAGEARSKGGKEICKLFGGGLTTGALQKHCERSVRPNAKALKAALDNGDDPMKTVSFTIEGKGRNANEISSIMGSDTTPNGIRFQFTDRFKPLAKRQMEMKAAGLDPKNAVVGSGKTSRKISRYFGSDSTAGGIQFQFRSIKADAKRQRDCIAAHSDPKDLGIGSSKDIAYFMADGTTRAALDHRFRPIKKDAAAMRAGTFASPIAGGSNGDGADNGSAIKKAGSARKPAAKRTPKPKKTFRNDDDDDSEGFDAIENDTPSKKSGLNKVASGRITKPKTPRRAAAAAPGKYAESDDEDSILYPIKNERVQLDEDDVNTGMNYNHAPVFNGGHSSYSVGNGYTSPTSNGNGHRAVREEYDEYGQEEEEEEQYHPVNDYDDEA